MGHGCWVSTHTEPTTTWQVRESMAEPTSFSELLEWVAPDPQGLAKYRRRDRDVAGDLGVFLPTGVSLVSVGGGLYFRLMDGGI